MAKFVIGIIICLALIALSVYAIANNGVSLQYEVENPGDCISLSSGTDLCFTENILWGMVILGIIGGCYFTYRLNFRKQSD
ncbi:hypothetical protein [Flavobacterium sp.]|uniref:hypothetical protein n=1 Tax=Flavobacterium sp. TaxID=239 RepID=UPI0040348579